MPPNNIVEVKFTRQEIFDVIQAIDYYIPPMETGLKKDLTIIRTKLVQSLRNKQSKDVTNEQTNERNVT